MGLNTPVTFRKAYDGCRKVDLELRSEFAYDPFRNLDSKLEFELASTRLKVNMFLMRHSRLF